MTAQHTRRHLPLAEATDSVVGGHKATTTAVSHELVHYVLNELPPEAGRQRDSHR
jgi:hypothetical protein